MLRIDELAKPSLKMMQEKIEVGGYCVEQISSRNGVPIFAVSVSIKDATTYASFGTALEAAQYRINSLPGAKLEIVELAPVPKQQFIFYKKNT